MAEIQVRNVSKEFLDASGKPFRALRDISFTWVKGENISFTWGKRQWKKHNGPPLNRFGTTHQWRDFA